MGTFELDRERGRERDTEVQGAETLAGAGRDLRRIRQECIIALKVYDHCRQPYCKIHKIY